MSEVKRLFQILDEMNIADGDNKTSNVGICNSLVSADYSAKKGGTVVAIGVPGNVVFDIETGNKIAILLIINMAEYNITKKS